MLAIAVEFLHGTVRATAAADTSITGAGNAGEWPPSPARLFSALVAADGTRGCQRVTDGREMALLEGADPPRIFADGLEAVLRSDLRERFVVLDKAVEGAVQQYAGRTSEAVRPGTRLAPCSPKVIYLWDHLEVDSRAHAALKRRAARIGYLGCSDSPVRVRVLTSPPASSPSTWVPSDDGLVVLPVPYRGLLDALDDAYDRSLGGEPVRRASVPNRYVRYRPPGTPDPQPPRPTVVWLRFEKAVSGRRLRAVTETLRAAVLDRYGEHEPTEVPSALHGHGFEGKGFHHAYFLGLPDVGHPHARGRLHGGAIVLPPGTPAPVVEGVRAAVWRISHLVRSGSLLARVRPHGGEPKPVAASPQRWEGPARQWVSATPVVHERFQAGGPDSAEVQRWCDHAAVRAQVLSARASRVPIIEGALSLHPTEVLRPGRERAPYSHLAVEFDRPVRGPLVLGRGRQFGFGLMYPILGGDQQADG
ncbi:MAG: type I-G CRISPR-associated protein Csb2 [Acidimicrobiales bacterium]